MQLNVSAGSTKPVFKDKGIRNWSPFRRLISFDCPAMVTFTGKSILYWLALEDGTRGPMAFAAVRLVSVALVLELLVRDKVLPWQGAGRWLEAYALAIFGWYLPLSCFRWERVR